MTHIDWSFIHLQIEGGGEADVVKAAVEKDGGSTDATTSGGEIGHRHRLSSLDEQERRTRIAFLQNRQAELETEICLLRQSQGETSGVENLQYHQPNKDLDCNQANQGMDKTNNK